MDDQEALALKGLLTSTSSWTWIDTTIIDASLLWWAVSIHCTFRTTSRVGIAEVVVSACTNTIVAISIRTAWRWIAWWRFDWFVNFNFGALCKRIAGKSCSTLANRNVILYTTFSIPSTWSFARISTLLSDTRFIGRAVSVHNAFWSAVRWSTEIVWQTCARWSFAYWSTFGITSAWRRIARIDWSFWCFYLIGFRNRWATDKRISGHIRWATAYWIMIDNFTASIDTARSRTRIGALEFVASFIQWTFRIDCTFRSAVRWRSNVFIEARTYCNIVDNTTIAVRSTWARLTGISWCVDDFRWFAAWHQRITNVSV